jgi:hypothetical protein
MCGPQTSTQQLLLSVTAKGWTVFTYIFQNFLEVKENL